MDISSGCSPLHISGVTTGLAGFLRRVGGESIFFRAEFYGDMVVVVPVPVVDGGMASICDWNGLVFSRGEMVGVVRVLLCSPSCGDVGMV